MKIQLNLISISDVRLQIFTTVSRKIRDITIPQVAAGMDATLDLVDKAGDPLANGLYFVAITTSQGKLVQKLLILK